MASFIINPFTGDLIPSNSDFTQSGTGAIQRTVDSKLKETVSVKDFGAVGDGTTDDTAAVIAAMTQCRSTDKILLMEGNLVVNASSVPGGASYINGCSMKGTGNATITINGFVGFNMQGVTDTSIENLRIVTNNRQRTESSNPGTYVTIFNTASGTKNSAVYRNLAVVNNVTSTTGEYRADPVIQEYGCQQCLFDNISATNITTTLIVYSSSNILISGVTSTNVQTNIYLASVYNFRIQNCSLINTKQQADYWVGRTFSTPRSFNGLDNVLVEQGDYGIITGLLTEWAIERAAYIQSSNVKIIGCYARNCGGYKTVGNSYTSQVVNAQVNSCHLTLDSNFALTRGRANFSLVEIYWITNVVIDSCSIINTQPAMTSVYGVSISTIGGAGVRDVYIKNCTIINTASLVRTDMSTLTTAAVAALSPPGTLLAAENVVIEGCTYKSANIRNNGALYTHRDVDASADAKATYATKSLTLTNNTIYLATAGVDRHDWFFDFRYMDGVRSVNNAVDLPFVNNGLFSSVITAPSQNIYMNEQGLWHNANPGTIVANLANFNLLYESALKFTGLTSTAGTVATVSTLNFNTGAPSAGFVTIEITGKGYFNTSTSASWAVQMCANGLYYFGNVIAGVKTDQVGTPPVTISTSGTDIDIRGDLLPTVLYSVKLTKV
jgi:hypothetical protein